MDLANGRRKQKSNKRGEEKGAEVFTLTPISLPASVLAVAVSILPAPWPELSLGPRSTASSLVPSDLEMGMFSTTARPRVLRGSLDPVLASCNLSFIKCLLIKP